ncbi:MAG: response regulator [Nanoarchaeota archaeon]|nr:response regulator [Nanoarchaeota archaeon]
MDASKRLLVVEDEKVVRDGLRSEISTWGYHVDALADGQDLLQNYVPGEYDAVLMDTQMERSVGYEVCAELRKLDSKIIIIGMSSDKAYHLAWMDAGATHFLPKARLHCDLQKVLQQYLNK